MTKHKRLPPPPWPHCLTWADPRFDAIATHNIVMWLIVTPLLVFVFGVPFSEFGDWYLVISLVHAYTYLQGYTKGRRTSQSYCIHMMALMALAADKKHPGLGTELVDVAVDGFKKTTDQKSA